MANQKVGQIWRHSGGTDLQTVKLLPSGTNAPSNGDICQVDSAGLPQFMATTSTGTTKTVNFICAEGYAELDVLNKPGYVAPSGSVPGVAQFGGRGSRDDNTAGKRMMFVVVDLGLQVVVTIASGGANPAVGTTYGFVRNASGDYTLDNTNTTQLALTIVGLYAPDVEAGLSLSTTPRARVWVKFPYAAGPI